MLLLVGVGEQISNRGYIGEMTNPKALGYAAAIGAVAGLRSIMAPAAVSLAASRGDLAVKGPAVKWLRSRTAAKILIGLAIGELVVDKLPIAPDRTDPPSLAFRILSGALCGAAICSASGNTYGGAIVGSTAAIAAAFAGLKLRRTAYRQEWPDMIVALAEDAVAIGAGAAATRAAATNRV